MEIDSKQEQWKKDYELRKEKYKLTPEQEAEGYRIGILIPTNLFDKNNNCWNLEEFSLEEAIKASKTLVNCKECSNCVDCQNCDFCSWCKNCEGCKNCWYCEDCSDCEDCIECQSFVDTIGYSENKPRIRTYGTIKKGRRKCKTMKETK